MSFYYAHFDWLTNFSRGTNPRKVRIGSHYDPNKHFNYNLSLDIFSYANKRIELFPNKKDNPNISKGYKSTKKGRRC